MELTGTRVVNPDFVGESVRVCGRQVARSNSDTSGIIAVHYTAIEGFLREFTRWG